MKGLYRKLSMLLLVAMLFSMLGPVGVYATDVTTEAQPQATEQVGTSAPVEEPDVNAQETTGEIVVDPAPVEVEGEVAPKVSQEVAAEPTASAAPETDGQLTADQKTEEAPQEQGSEAEKETKELTFFEQLMELKTCKEIYNVLNAEGNEDKVLALTKDQLNSLKTYVAGLPTDETTEELQAQIEYLITGEYDVETLGRFPQKPGGSAKEDQDSFYTHSFNHIDIRIAGASLSLTTKVVDVETRETISSDTKEITAFVTKVHSATINDQTYTGFEKSGDYEYRYMGTSIIVTDSSTASFVVDLKDSSGKTYSNVSVTYGIEGIKAAAVNCDGYHNNYGKPSYNGLDFYISGTSTTVTYTTISFPVQKKWEDNNDQDGLRPRNITVELYKDNKSTGKTLVLNAANNWSGSFDNLTSDSSRYSVLEKNVPDGYLASYEKSGRIITNTHTPKTVTVSGKKTWIDDSTEKRPGSITVNLLANGVIVNSKIVKPNDNGEWTYEFTDLPEYQNGKKIVYSVSEVDVEDYTATYDGYNITNTYNPGVRSISVTKVWDDGNDQDGKRPGSITVTLLSNSEITDNTLTLNATNNWSGEFADLLIADGDGKTIEYSVKELEVDDYTSKITGNMAEGFTITNTHEPEMIGEISVSKVWNDEDNQDGYRPASVTVKLYANNEDTGKSVTLNEKNNWKGSFSDLPAYENGREITYTVRENDVTEYTAKVTGNVNDGFVVTNTHKPVEYKEVTVTKKWVDKNNADNVRPSDVVVTLYEDGVATEKEVTLNASNSWTASFENLPIYKEGKVHQEITYTVKEKTVTGYESYVSGSVHEGFTVTNYLLTDIIGTKTWNDGDNQDGIRPKSIKVQLSYGEYELGTVTTDATKNWTYTFKDLIKYDDEGNEIQYTVTELDVEDGYTATVNGYNITNTHAPEKTSVTVAKDWDDNNNQDGKRTAVTVNLLADGDKTGKTLTLSDSNNWTGSFTDLDVYKGGKVIQYTVAEDEVDGYTAEISGDAEKGYVITNTHTPEKTIVTVTKDWDDNNNQDGKRTAVTVNLLADGDETGKTLTLSDSNNWTGSFTDLDVYKGGKVIQYTVAEDEVDGYTAEISGDAEKGYTITNTHTPETIDISGTKIWNDSDNQDGKRPDSITVVLYADGDKKDTKTVTAEDDWKYEFEDLPVYKDGGKEIIYTIVEAKVDGYSTEYDGTDIINSYTPEQTSVKVIKKWDDNNNQDGVRPKSVTVRLFADGEETQQYVTLDAENEWTASFTGLDKFRDGGEEIDYTVVEDAVENYEASVDKDDNGVFIVTNTHEAIKLEGSITGTKTWDDNNDQDGIRPTSITVNLLANGQQVASQKVTAENGWKYEFKNLDKYYDGGQEIEYTVEEVAVKGYTSKVNRYNITNTHEPAKLEGGISGTKTWDDNDNQDGIRPESVTVNLLANGKKVASKTVTEKDGWKYSFTDLDKYENGKEIVYTVTEEAVKGYTAKVNGYNITNTHEPEKLEGGVSGTKTWDDKNNQDGVRPESITVNLLANGKKVASKTVTEKDGWKYSFTDLDKYENGKEIVYTVTEEAVKGYTAKVDGYNITNTHETETTVITVEKKWVDNDDKEGKRPGEITVQLYANGEKLGDAVKITAKDGWKYEFKDLDKYANGKLVEYTVKETSEKYYVAKYTAKDDVLTITNTFVDIPLTGDTINLLFWTMMVLGAGAVLGGMGFFFRRRRT